MLLCANYTSAEVRNWLLLLLAIVGAFVTIRTFIASTRQRKIDNTFKILDFLRRHITDEQIQTFIELFHANNELSGVKYNEFKFTDGRIDSIEYMFSEGGCGNGDIQNIIEIFSLISPTINDLEVKFIWYEYGQIMATIYSWTQYLEEKRKTEIPLGQIEFYSEFNMFMKRNSNNMISMPTKYYTYLE